MGGLLSKIKCFNLLDNAWFNGVTDSIWDLAMNIFGHILWIFSDIFFIILDVFEGIFKAFAGISTGVTGSLDGKTEKIEGDLVLYFIQSDLVQDIFISIVILSVILLIIFTIFAIVKNQYAEKQEPVKKIIGNSFKGLWLYLAIPVATVVCLLVGNIVLQAIDGATKTTDTAGASEMLFTTAAHNANKFRGDNPEDHLMYLEEKIGLPSAVKERLKSAGVDFDNIEASTSVDWELCAQIIDNAYVSGELDGEWWSFDVINTYYSSSEISYITIWVGGAFLVWAIGKISWGMVARLFKMVLYFAISPAVVATYPIKGDGPLKSWTGEMAKNGTSAYCAVGVLNVLYSILPFVTDINFFGFGLFGQFGTSIVRLFIYIIAFSSAQNLIGTVSGWFGTGDAIKDGKEAKGQVKAGFETAKKSLAKPGEFTGKVGKAIAGFQGGKEGASILHNAKIGEKRGIRDSLARFGGGLIGAYKSSGAADSFIDPLKVVEDMKGGKKTGKEYYQGVDSTLHFKQAINEQRKEMYELDKSMKDSVKATEKLIEALEKARQIELAKATTDADKKKINDRYDRAVGDAKFKAQFMDSAWEARKMAIESEKQAYDQDMSNVAPLDNWLKASKKEEAFKQRLATGVKGGYAKVQTNWKQMVEKNDFSGFGDQADDVKAAFGQMFDSIMENNETLKLSTEGIKNITAQGGVASEYYKSIFGESFTGDMKGHKPEYMDKIETEMGRLKDLESSITSSQKQLRDEIIEQYDKVKNSATALAELIKKNTKN